MYSDFLQRFQRKDYLGKLRKELQRLENGIIPSQGKGEYRLKDIGSKRGIQKKKAERTKRKQQRRKRQRPVSRRDTRSHTVDTDPQQQHTSKTQVQRVHTSDNVPNDFSDMEKGQQGQRVIDGEHKESTKKHDLSKLIEIKENVGDETVVAKHNSKSRTIKQESTRLSTGSIPTLIEEKYQHSRKKRSNSSVVKRTQPVEPKRVYNTIHSKRRIDKDAHDPEPGNRKEINEIDGNVHEEMEPVTGLYFSNACDFEKKKGKNEMNENQDKVHERLLSFG